MPDPTSELILTLGDWVDGGNPPGKATVRKLLDAIDAADRAAATPHDDEALLFGAGEALRLTREYVGAQLLPPLLGWTWFDAYRALADRLDHPGMRRNIERWVGVYQRLDGPRPNRDANERALARETPARPGWHDYFLGIAEAVAARADCTRSRVGAVIVRDHRIVATGYNGAPAGVPGCLEGACPRGCASKDDVPSYGSFDDPDAPGFCIAVHAEANAIVYADTDRMRGGTIYVTKRPCAGCAKLIAAAGLTAVWRPADDDPVVSGGVA